MRKESLVREEAELEDLENTQPVHMQKMGLDSGKNQRCGQPVAKEISCMTCGFLQLRQ